MKSKERVLGTPSTLPAEKEPAWAVNSEYLQPPQEDPPAAVQDDSANDSLLSDVSSDVFSSQEN